MNGAMSVTTGNDDEAIGLYFLFGHDLWVPSGGNTDTSAFKIRFETLVVGGSINGEDLLKQIPADLRNKFDIEARTQRGFKFEWQDTANVSWHVHGHESDAGAKSGHLGAKGWTCRIRYDDKYWLLPVMPNPQFRQGHAKHQPPTMWTQNKKKMGDTHLPLKM
jgi:Bacterial toxin 30